MAGPRCDAIAGRRWAEQGPRTDERLDQLVDLFERHLRDDHDRPPS